VRRGLWIAILLLSGCASRGASTTAAAPSPPSPPGSPAEADEYTRYELLDPSSASFHILYEVTAIKPGADVFFNPIRRGSKASGERVADRMSGEDLKFDVVSSDEARRSGLADAEKDTDYIRIHLPRAVPSDGGQVRLLIEKTYRDPKSYFERDGAIFFVRSLSIRRNAIVLPAGFELVSCNVPSQVATEKDGRIRVSFVNAGPADMPVEISARRLPS